MAGEECGEAGAHWQSGTARVEEITFTQLRKCRLHAAADAEEDAAVCSAALVLSCPVFSQS